MYSLQTQVRAGVNFGHGKFFRTRLLVLDSDQISNIVDQMDKESADIRQEAIKLSWYMRGGISYEQALQLSSAERTTISDLIKENLETTMKTGLPFF